MTQSTNQSAQMVTPLTRSVLSVAAISAFLTFTNPFGATSGLPLWGAFLYWLALVGEGWFGGPFLGEMLRRVAPKLSPILNRIIVIALVGVAVTVTIIVVQAAIQQPVPVSYWPRLYVLVLGISVAISAIAWLVDRAFAGQPGAVTHAPAAGAATPPVRFLERLPAKLKGAIIYAISAEDHYLRLHTSKGADLILMRLSDAITELEGLEGAQTHRSWWVARDAVESSRREGDRVTLILKGGVEAPVSRPNVKPLRDAGWF
ncbi:LytTR family DNA-binding domain-containing protein [Terricaulis sp.]|uniref:LytTR family DNA-binding domain-containing protein n=1 Tax=Terricaulis sp. TaxID=2768686 RepID=UPI002AC66FC2|nr:LytTR family DNA-binding domain-containing protein [Terricaulis sp.]MDZ4691184.1 LytTR family DNA-binding domain-containing protein [Terricaulis sp.]